LIDETREKVLRSFREDLRNKYSHFNIQKITKGFSFSATEKNVEKGEEKIDELTASAPTLQILVKHRLDEENVMKVFKLADGVVRPLSGIWSWLLCPVAQRTTIQLDDAGHLAEGTKIRLGGCKNWYKRGIQN
jgi:hypothetical protein